MDAERSRAFLLALPHVAETLQWGEKLVFWVGDRSIGGRIFAIIDLEATPGVLTPAGKVQPVLAFAAGPARYSELLENEAILPAPHLARAHWVALADWSALPAPELQEQLRAAHERIFGRLSRKTRTLLAPETQRSVAPSSPSAPKGRPAKPRR